MRTSGEVKRAKRINYKKYTIFFNEVLLFLAELHSAWTGRSAERAEGLGIYVRIATSRHPYVQAQFKCNATLLALSRYLYLKEWTTCQS